LSADRFWSKVDKAAGCWIWTASTTANGIGQFGVCGKVGGRKMVAAHRHAWRLVHGAMPSGMLRHACGNLRCVRPDHMVQQARRRGPNSLAKPPAVRFQSKVMVGPGCWLWQGSTDRRGFGQFRDYDLDAERPGRMLRAHRFAWELDNGPVPRGFEVDQVCGTRVCVRPDHLALVDPARRQSEPTPRQVEVLRRLAELGTAYGSLQTVATELGLHRQTVTNLVFDARKRLGVRTTDAAIALLPEAEARTTSAE
jgi:DNA-binding CsgD family transcriptional regulator